MKKSNKTKVWQTVLLVAGAVSLLCSFLASEYIPVNQHISNILFVGFLVLGVVLMGLAMKKEPNTEHYCCCSCSKVYVPQVNYHLGRQMKTECPQCQKKTIHVFIPKESQ